MEPNDPPVELGSELDFLRELWALDHALQRSSKMMARDLGITGPQRLALRLVSRFPGLPAGRLARLLHLHPSTVTGVVRRLVDRGLLARRADGLDRRRAHLQITPTGLALLGRPQMSIEAVVQNALRALKPREVEAAVKAFAVVAMGLESAAGKPRTKSL